MVPTQPYEQKAIPGGAFDRVPLVQVRGLRTHFPVRDAGLLGRRGLLRAVDGVSFDIPGGTTLGLVGESGCGKTTVGRSILRLIEPTSGEVLFDGVHVGSASRRAMFSLRRDMQIVFQDPAGSLNPRMRVGAIVAEPLEVHRVGDRGMRRRRVGELLERVGLRATDADRYPSEFSGGQRQRIGVARAMALTPRFIVLDEPVSALDVSIQAQVLNLLSDLRDELGLTYLFIAHNLAVVARFSERVAVMYLGKIVEIGDSEALFTRPQHPYTMALLAASPEPELGRARPAALVGEPPSPLEPPSGCAFHLRCPYTTAECREITPILAALDGADRSHQVACHHAGRLVPLGVGERIAGRGEKNLASPRREL